MKKTILFALSALLVGACAKEDPEEKEIFPDVPPRQGCYIKLQLFDL